VLLALDGTRGRRKDTRRDGDTSGRSSSGEAKTKKRGGKGHRNIVPEWNRRRAEREGQERESAREREDTRRRDGEGIGLDARRARREEKAPRVVPGGPRPVETAQRLKPRGIILL